MTRPSPTVAGAATAAAGGAQATTGPSGCAVGLSAGPVQPTGAAEMIPAGRGSAVVGASGSSGWSAGRARSAAWAAGRHRASAKTWTSSLRAVDGTGRMAAPLGYAAAMTERAAVDPADPAVTDPLGPDALDFWLGTWLLSWTGGGRGSNTIRRILDDRVIEESFLGGDPDGSLAGRSLSVRDAADGRWRQTWVDSTGAYLVFVGVAVDGRIAFQRETVLDGVPTVQRIVWLDVGTDTLRWEWQHSATAARPGRSRGPSTIGAPPRSWLRAGARAGDLPDLERRRRHRAGTRPGVVHPGRDHAHRQDVTGGDARRAGRRSR